MLFALSSSPATTVVLWDLRYWLIDLFSLRGTTGAALIMLGAAILCIVGPYFIGSINPAIVISKLVYHDDIRRHGSGNAGSTNMLRTYGKKAAVATFTCDVLKAVIAVLLGRLLLGEMGMSIAGFFVGFGHIFPAYYHLQGGKGVACYATVALMINPPTFLFMLLIFLIVLIGTRYVSLASVMGALLYPLLLNAFAPNFSMGVAAAVLEACFVVFMHRENLKRIWNHTESKLDFSKLKIHKKKKEPPTDGTDGGNGNA